jgi:hypothetical protein
MDLDWFDGSLPQPCYLLTEGSQDSEPLRPFPNDSSLVAEL